MFWFQSCWAPSATTSFLLSVLTERSRFSTRKALAFRKTTRASLLLSSHRSCGTRLASLGRPQSSRPRLSCECTNSCSSQRAKSAFATITRTGRTVAKKSTTGVWCGSFLKCSLLALRNASLHPHCITHNIKTHCISGKSDVHCEGQWHGSWFCWLF